MMDSTRGTPIQLFMLAAFSLTVTETESTDCFGVAYPDQSTSECAEVTTMSAATLRVTSVAEQNQPPVERGEATLRAEWQQVQDDAREVSGEPSDDGEYATIDACRSLARHIHSIARHLPRPDTWSFLDGEISIEQHDGSHAMLCRIMPKGQVRISEFEGPKRVGDPILL